MSAKLTSSHLARAVCVYLRQSTTAQVERNRESTARQYQLVDRAVELGWRRDQMRVIDADLGVSGAGTARREGFEGMASEVALGRVGLILAIEVSRVARNNAEWYRLLDFCGVIDQEGRVRKKSRLLPRAEWQVLIRDHHPGFIDWDTYEMNQARLAKNTRPLPQQSGGAIREGAALLQGLATCGRCGRKLKVYYQGQHSTPGYHCPGSTLANGRAVYCMRVGGMRIDRAVSDAFLDAVEPVGIEAAFEAERILDADRDAALAQWRLQVERAEYEAQRAERRYRAVEPENRLVARRLEAEWETRLGEVAAAKTELEHHQRTRPRPLTEAERTHLRVLGADLQRAWRAPSTTDRDRKELLHTLLEEVLSCPLSAHATDLTPGPDGGVALSPIGTGLRHKRRCSACSSAPRGVYPFTGLSQLYLSGLTSWGCIIRLRTTACAFGRRPCLGSRRRVGASSARMSPPERAPCLHIHYGLLMWRPPSMPLVNRCGSSYGGAEARCQASPPAAGWPFFLNQRA